MKEEESQTHRQCLGVNAAFPPIKDRLPGWIKNQTIRKQSTIKTQPYAIYKKLTSLVTQTEIKRLEKAISFQWKFQTMVSNCINIPQSQL